MPIITLTTDFGYRDPYVGSMKGVILRIHPGVTLVDLSHEIAPQNIGEAAFFLSSVYRFFPKKTIHVVVVDPGVGSGRKILCVKTATAYFLAPDNGVLTAILRHEPHCLVREVTNDAFFLEKISPTFHGRDKMAPVAAHLSRGDIFSRLGPRLGKQVEISWSEPRVSINRVDGEVLHVDRFGNLVTNIEDRHLDRHPYGPKRIRLGHEVIAKWVRYYAEGKKGELVALMNSSGHVEIAVCEGSAAAKSDKTVGARVSLLWS